jgi:hypothetical protein
MDISKYISELLFEHDCVIIPEFGGFVANYQPADIHPVQHRFNPPSKSILFNINLTKNDGLLASHISIAENISYINALEKIKEFSAEIRHSLAGGQKVVLQDLGEIYADTDGNISFEQTKTQNYLPEVFGMDSFVSPAISRRIKRPAPITPKPQPISDNRNYNRRRPALALQIAAGISIVFILSFLGYSLLPVNSSFANLSGFLPTGKNAGNNNQSNYPAETPEKNTVKQEVSENTIVPVPATPANINEIETNTACLTEIENGKISAQKEDISETSAIKNSDDIAVSPPAQARVKYYHLIAGSFLETQNADNLIAFYKESGYAPVLTGPSGSGYYRVSIAAYLRKDEALEELKIVRDKFDPSVWLLRQ